MSFFHRKAVRPALSSTLTVDKFISDEITGLVSRKSVPAEGPLPSMDTYDYAKMIKAGVDMRQVNTSILGSVQLSEVPEDEPKDEPKDEPEKKD